MPERRLSHHLAWLTVSTLCFSFVGVVRAQIDLPSAQTSFWRGAFALLSVGTFLLAGRARLLRVRWADTAPMLGLGVLICGNWYFYFEAIRISGVAVAVIALFTHPLITALLEPFLFREQRRSIDLLGAAMVVFGVYLIQPRFDPASATFQGVALGLCSAASFAGANLLSRRLVRTYQPSTLLFYQSLVATVFFAAAVAGPGAAPMTWRNLALLVLLGAVLTTTAQLLLVASLRHFSTSLASVLLSLQPFYTVLLAWLIAGQRPSERTIWGGVVITLSVLLVSVYHAMARQSQQPR
jgi:drug/metabolite transporter (DMT)-like permease